MMALNFPSNPALYQTYQLGERTWQWNGTAWDLLSDGEIDDTPIGNSTPAAAAFVTLSSTDNTILGNIAGNLLPVANVTYDLGSTTRQWGDVYLSNATIYLGDAQISASGDQLVLPAGSQIGTANLVVGPKITGIDYPGDDTAANPAGGQTITVNGSNFESGCIVTIAGAAVSVTTFVSSSQLTFVSPAKSTGAYTLEVVNPDGTVGTALPGLIYSGTPTWTTAAGSIGTPYELNSFATTVAATGDAPVTYAVAAGNSLPANMTLNTSNGYVSVSSVPAVNNDITYNFSLEAIDAEQQETPRQFSVTYKADVVTWSAPANASTVTSYLNIPITPVTLSASAATGRSVSYALASGSLPSNITLSGSTITGAGNVLVGNSAVVFRATSADTNKSADRTIYFQVVNDTVTWSAPAYNTTYSAYETAPFGNIVLSAQSAANQAVSYSLFSGSLPAGLSLSGNTISGTSTAIGSLQSTYRATAAVTGATADLALNFNVMQDVVTWSSPPDGNAYNLQTSVASTIALSASAARAGQSIAYSLASGALPAGVSISGSNITGTPTTAQSNTAAVIRATANLTNRYADRTLYFSVTTPARAIIGGGQDTGGTASAWMGYFTMTTTYTEVAKFGDLSQARTFLGSAGSTTRALFAGGTAASTRYATIDYVTIASLGNASNFGSLTQAREQLGGANSNTRALFVGGWIGSASSVIDYVEMASTGNASNFGSLSPAKTVAGVTSSPTRMVTGGGYTTTNTADIQYVTIANTGNSLNFGSLTAAKRGVGAASSNTRAVFTNGYANNWSYVIEYITIASTGNSTDFGTGFNYALYFPACCSDQTRVYVQGDQYVQTYLIASGATGSTFGQLAIGTRYYTAGTSSANGGLSL